MFVEQMLPQARQRLATIRDEAPVREAADLMCKPATELVVVCAQDGVMVGVVTKTDIVAQISHCLGGGCVARVDTIMTRAVICCRPGQSLHEVWSVMKQAGLQRIPLIDQQRKPIGIIYARDALQTLLDEVGDEEILLRDYVMNIGYR